MNASKVSTVRTSLYCDECGEMVEILRRAKRLKKMGHTKHMWCHICKKVTAHTEQVKPMGDWE